MDFSTFRSWFDERFDAYLEKHITRFVAYSDSTEVLAIATYARTVARGGKRFRPYLVYSALAPTDAQDHFELFAAVELLHVFALVHDDIMDSGTTRHGALCAHRAFADRYHDVRIAEGVAVLLGDLLYQWSYESLLAYTTSHPQQGAQLVSIFGELIREVIHGQMMDVISPTQPPLSQELIEQKMYLKTARYSFVQPMRLGFAAAGVLDARNAFAEGFGRCLGLMFQLQDDLIDVSQGHDKSSFVDIETNQQTLLSWFMHAQATEQYRAQFAGYVGKKLSSVDQEAVAKCIQESGARAYVQERIDAYYQEAIALADTPVWQALASMVYTRNN